MMGLLFRVAACTSAFFSAGPPDEWAAQLSRSFTDSRIDGWNSVHYTIRQETELVGDVAPPACTRDIVEIVFIKKGDWVDIARNTQTFRKPDSPDPYSTGKIRYVITDRAGRLDKNEWYGAGPGANPAWTVLGMLRSKEDARTGAGTLSEDARILDGWADSDISLPEVLREGSLAARTDMETVDGHPTHVLEATTPHGKYTLWLDPDFGFLPRKLEIRKKGSDILSGAPTNAPPKELPAGAVPKFPRVPIAEYRYVADEITLGMHDGRPYMAAAQVIETQTYENGQQVQFQHRITRSAYDPDPDFAQLAAFRFDVPDGTPVYDENAPGLEMEWRKGQPVLAVSSEDIQAIRDDVANAIADGHIPSALRSTPAARNAPAASSEVAGTGHSGRRAGIALSAITGGVLLLALRHFIKKTAAK